MFLEFRLSVRLSIDILVLYVNECIYIVKVFPPSDRGVTLVTLSERYCRYKIPRGTPLFTIPAEGVPLGILELQKQYPTEGC